MSMTHAEQVKHTETLGRDFLERALVSLEAAINCTPSGDVRDKITEANIIAMTAQRMLQEKQVKATG